LEILNSWHRYGAANATVISDISSQMALKKKLEKDIVLIVRASISKKANDLLNLNIYLIKAYS
jgi:hypothetical protein